jgi:hypothetical protein
LSTFIQRNYQLFLVLLLLLVLLFCCCCYRGRRLAVPVAVVFVIVFWVFFCCYLYNYSICRLSMCPFNHRLKLFPKALEYRTYLWHRFLLGGQNISTNCTSTHIWLHVNHPKCITLALAHIQVTNVDTKVAQMIFYSCSTATILINIVFLQF